MHETIPVLLLSSLAAWRITHLLAREDGPFDLVFRLRKKAGTGFFGSLLDCFYCLSLWIAVPFAWYAAGNWKEGLLLWLAISGAACLLEQFSSSYSKTRSPDYEEDKK